MPTDRVPGVVPGGARVFSPAAAILESEKTLGTRLINPWLVRLVFRLV